MTHEELMDLISDGLRSYEVVAGREPVEIVMSPDVFTKIGYEDHPGFYVNTLFAIPVRKDILAPKGSVYFMGDPPPTGSGGC